MKPTINHRATEAVKRLREKTLENGQKFLLHDQHLPADEGYLEYPDGSIKRVRVASPLHRFEVIEELSPVKASQLLKKHSLFAR